jgi:hypothetical protein
VTIEAAEGAPTITFSRSLGEPRLAGEGLLGRYERPRYRLSTVRVRDGWQLQLSRFVWCFLGALFLLSLAGSPVFGQQFENQLAWVDNSNNEDGFRLERKLGPTGNYAALTTVGTNTETYADTAVNSGVTYCYRVKAFNAAGESGYTNEVCAMPSLAASTSPPPATSSTSSPAPGSSETASAPAATGGGGGCFIATAAFGSPLAPQVQLLREVRDRYLLPYSPGRIAVQAYYAVSPPIADVISRSETLRAIVRFSLIPILGWAALALSSPAIGFGIPVLPVIAGVLLIARRSRQR